MAKLVFVDCGGLLRNRVTLLFCVFEMRAQHAHTKGKLRDICNLGPSLWVQIFTRVKNDLNPSSIELEL